MILRVGPSAPGTGDGSAEEVTEVELTYHAVLARWSGGGSGPVLHLELPGGTGVVSVADRQWDSAAAHDDRPARELVLRPLSDADDPLAVLGQSLDASRRWSAAGEVVAVGLDGDAGPVAAVVTASMMLGARVLVLPVDADDDVAREARRAADVTEVLLVERAG